MSSFDQNRDVKGEKKPSAPPANPGPGEEQNSSYEEFGTPVTPDTLLEMPAIDPATLPGESTPKPESHGWNPLAAAKPFGVLSSEPELPIHQPDTPKTLESEAPVSKEALAWLSGDENTKAETSETNSTLVLETIHESQPGEKDNEQPLEKTVISESPLPPETEPLKEEEKTPETSEPSSAPVTPISAASSEGGSEEPPSTPQDPIPVLDALRAVSGEKVKSQEPIPQEDSLELVDADEVKSENDEPEGELSSQIGWSRGLPEKETPSGKVESPSTGVPVLDAKSLPIAPKAPPPLPPKAPPPLPSGPQKAVSKEPPKEKKAISKLDLPPELFEDDPPTKAESAPTPAPATQAPKVLARGWWDTIFNEDFLRTNPAKSEAMTRKEADFIEQCLTPKPGDIMLDTACGYGRHVIELAGRGYQMVGLDLSLPYLMLAAEISTRRKLQANFIHGDMRDLQFKEYFDHGYCTFTSFGYFEDEANLESLRGIHRSLKPKGRFLLEVINRDFAVSACPLRGWWEGIGCVMLEETEFNYASSVLSTKRSVIFEDGRQAMQETHVRLYSLHELVALYKTVGFKILEVSGGVDLRGVFFGADSTHLVLLAEKQR